jgi:hypothetical protein
MSYFEPARPPPYFRIENNVILPPLVRCYLRPSYGHFYIGYIRCNNDTVKETWLSASEDHRPQVELRYCYGIHASPYDVVAVIDVVQVDLLPSYATSLLVRIFTTRHDAVMSEPDRINTARWRAFDALENS